MTHGTTKPLRTDADQLERYTDRQLHAIIEAAAHAGNTAVGFALVRAARAQLAKRREQARAVEATLVEDEGGT